MDRNNLKKKKLYKHKWQIPEPCGSQITDTHTCTPTNSPPPPYILTHPHRHPPLTPHRPTHSPTHTQPPTHPPTHTHSPTHTHTHTLTPTPTHPSLPHTQRQRRKTEHCRRKEGRKEQRKEGRKEQKEMQTVNGSRGPQSSWRCTWRSCGSLSWTGGGSAGSGRLAASR